MTHEECLKILASYNKHTSRNNNAIYKTYCLGEFEKENDMIKSCSNCMHRGASTSSIACRGCDLNTNPIFGGSLDKWMPYSRSIKNIKPIPAIKDVIFNPPATIIIWEDKTKTVVKCGENDIYDPEKGMAMAISRKALGDRGSYYNVFEKWLGKYDKQCEEVKVAYPLQYAIYETLSNMGSKTKELRKVINNMSENLLSYADESKSENNDNDCTTCKYEDLPDDYDPCIDCDHNYNEWKPKESDD